MIPLQRSRSAYVFRFPSLPICLEMQQCLAFLSSKTDLDSRGGRLRKMAQACSALTVKVIRSEGTQTHRQKAHDVALSLILRERWGFFVLVGDVGLVRHPGLVRTPLRVP